MQIFPVYFSLYIQLCKSLQRVLVFSLLDNYWFLLIGFYLFQVKYGFYIFRNFVYQLQGSRQTVSACLMKHHTDSHFHLNSHL